MSRRSRRAALEPFGMVFVGVVDKACNVSCQGHHATTKEGCGSETSMASAWEGSKDESWEEDEECKGAEGEGEVLWRERAKERVTSSASLNASESSFGKERRFTGTLKEEISWRSQRSSPPERSP